MGNHEHLHEHEHDHEECGCGHNHEQEHNKSLIWKKGIIFVISILLVILAFVPGLPISIRILFAAAVYSYYGYSVIVDTIKGFAKHDFFNENFLMTIATVGAIIIGEYADASAVMLFYSIGEFFCDIAYGKSKRSIENLMKISPEYAMVERNGEFIKILPSEVKIGETISVRAGERIPLDGIVLQGNANVDSSAITGESLPVPLSKDEKCISGTICLDGQILVRVESEYKNSIVSKIYHAVKEASSKKASTEKFITKFSRIYTPIVVFLAIIIFVTGFIITKDFYYWLKISLVMLVISCPCALILSIPLTYFAGIGSGSKNGILYKGGSTIDTMSNLSTIVFDKTGTLTNGKISLEGVYPSENIDKNEFINIAYNVLSNSAHPLAVAFCSSAPPTQKLDITNVSEIAGKGVTAYIHGKLAVFGNAALLHDYDITVPNEDGTLIYGSYDRIYYGFIGLSDKVKTEAKVALSGMTNNGIQRTIMMSGDKLDTVKKIADELNITEFYSGLMPHEKLEKFEEIYDAEKRKNKKAIIAFCGDGLNDSAVIARSDVGIAMGGIGSAATIGAADMVIMDDNMTKIVDGIIIAKNTKKLVIQNIIFSLSIKAIIMIISVFWYTSMELAVLADVGVTVLVILNAMRRKK